MAKQEHKSKEQKQNFQEEELKDEPTTNTKDVEAKEEEPKQEEASEKTEDTHEEALEKANDKFLRLYAEFENYKRRTSKERLELYKTANTELMQELLPVLDDLKRGRKELEKNFDQKSLEGFDLISSKLIKTLESKGLEQIIIEKEEDFNAEIHEAITQIPAPEEHLKGKIIDVIEDGYKLGEKMIRFPKVIIGT